MMLKALLLLQVLTVNHGVSVTRRSGVSSAIPRADLVPSAELLGARRRLENTFLKTNQENTINHAEYREKIISKNTFLREPVPTLNGQDHSALDQLSSQSHEAVHTSSPEHIHAHRLFHRDKRSLSLNEPSAASLRAPAKPHKPRKAPSQNFTLDIEGKHVLLYYGKELVIDMTSPRRLALTRADTVSYRERTVSVISGITEAGRYSSIDKLAIYSGRDMTTKMPEEEGVVLRAASAQLFVSGNTAFYSRSKHFNALLNRRLAEILTNRNKPKFPVEFRVFYGGKTLLTINNTSIIVLTDSEFREVSDRQTLLYSGNTLHIQDGSISEVFPAIEHFMTLNTTGRGERVTTHNPAITQTLQGRGDLYVHKQTNTAFYSRDSIINNKITEFQMGLRPSLHNTVFSIRFETRHGGGPLEVVISANGYDILWLQPHRVIDQSVSTRHYVTYANSTVYVMDGARILDAIENIKEIRLHNDDQLHHYTTGSSEQIPGGGQLFTCQGLGLYSVDADLNDRIGDALLGAEVYPPMPPSSEGAETHLLIPSSLSSHAASNGCGPNPKEKCTKDTYPPLLPSPSSADGCGPDSKARCADPSLPPASLCKSGLKNEKMCTKMDTTEGQPPRG